MNYVLFPLFRYSDQRPLLLFLVRYFFFSILIMILQKQIVYHF